MSEKNAKKNRVKRELPEESKNWKRPEKRRFIFGKNNELDCRNSNISAIPVDISK